MESNVIKELLLKNFPEYERKLILLEDLSKRINALPEKYQAPLVAWLNGKKVPAFSYSGYSVNGLVSQGFTIPSAVLTIAWLEYDTTTALQALDKLKLKAD